MLTIALFCALSQLLLADLTHEIAFSFLNADENDILEGKKLYEDFSLKVLSYGDCWQRAVSELHTSCKMLTEDSQSRLALSFANCFLEMTGQETCFCPENKHMSECLKSSDERIFSTYRSFFTHTKSICYFLEQRAWQQDVENTVMKLSASSHKLIHQLEDSLKSQDEMLDLQQTSIELQKLLIKTSEQGMQNLNAELDCMLNDTKGIVREFQATSQEQNFLMMTVFEQVKKLEALVLGKFADFYTVAYYFLAILLSYLLTSSRRTADGRIWLMLLFTGNAVVEKFISNYSMIEESKSPIFLLNNGPILDRIWVCRNICCIFAVILLLVVFIRYKDYDMMNNQLLIEIQKRIAIQNAELENLMKNLSNANMSSVGGKFPSFLEVKSAERNMVTESCFSLSPQGYSLSRQQLEKRAENHLHSTPDQLRCKTATSPSRKPRKRAEAIPFSPIEKLPADPVNSKSETLQDVSNRKYNLRDRSRLSSTRTILTSVSLQAKISQECKEIARKVKRNRN